MRKKNNENDENDEDFEDFEAEELLKSLFETERLRQISVTTLRKELEELEERGGEENQKRIEDIKAELSMIDPEPETEEEKEMEKRISVILRNRRIKIARERRYNNFLKVMIACLLLIIIVYVISIATTGRSLFEGIYTLTREIFKDTKEKTLKDDIDEPYASDIREYDNLEEFKQTEKIDILAPEYISGNKKIYKIEYRVYVNNICISYSGETFLTVYLNTPLIDINSYNNEAEEYSFNGMNYYIFKKNSTISWEYDENAYILKCSEDIDDYKKIIESIK
ncbi:MAG: hypothetical protein FWF92_07155 [Oscillospiraceae bacterium]|nr:hypothetical protein [Oscillospiraceae bacterium]